MVQVKQTMLVTAGGWGEYWTLDAVWTLGRWKKIKKNNNFTIPKYLLTFEHNLQLVINGNTDSTPRLRNKS